VNERARGLALIVVSTTLCAAPTLAADPASDVSTTKDLTAVIALQGMPCGEVVSAKKQGENDYLAACKDGNRYRVFQNAEGRVIVEKK
jgi:cytochrome c biogenesis protein ResB